MSSVEDFFSCHDSAYLMIPPREDVVVSESEEYGIHYVSSSFVVAPRRRSFRPNVWIDNDLEFAERIVRHYHQNLLPTLRETKQSLLTTDNNERILLIPKCIHFIWLGPDPIPNHPPTLAQTSASSSSSPLPTTRLVWNGAMESWREHHPQSEGWTIRLWNEEDLEVLQLNHAPSSSEEEDSVLMSEFHRAYRHELKRKNFGMASDMARLEILYRMGGVYVDVDYYCTSSVDEYHSAFHFYCGASNCACVEMNNGLMGCESHHPLVRCMMEHICKWHTQTTRYSHCCCHDSNSLPNNNGNSSVVVVKGEPSSLVSSFLDEASAKSLKSVTDEWKRTVRLDEVIEHTGPGLLTRTLYQRIMSSPPDMESDSVVEEKEKNYNLGIAVLPAVVFHPLPNDTEFGSSIFPNNTLKKYATDNHHDTRAIHMWGRSWQK